MDVVPDVADRLGVVLGVGYLLCQGSAERAVEERMPHSKNCVSRTPEEFETRRERLQRED